MYNVGVKDKNGTALKRGDVCIMTENVKNGTGHLFEKGSQIVAKDISWNASLFAQGDHLCMQIHGRCVKTNQKEA